MRLSHFLHRRGRRGYPTSLNHISSGPGSPSMTVSEDLDSCHLFFIVCTYVYVRGRALIIGNWPFPFILVFKNSHD